MKSMFRRPGDSNSSSEEDSEAPSSTASQDSSAGPSSLPPTGSSSLRPEIPATATPDPPTLNPVTLYSPLHPSIPSLPQNHHVTLLISSLLESHISSRMPDNPALAEQLYIDIARQLSDFGITPKNSELFARGELASVRQNYVEGIDTLLQQGLQKKNDENRGGCTSAGLTGDGQLSLVRRDNKPTLRRMMTDLPGNGKSMDGRKVIHRSSSLSILANATKSTKYRPSTAPALAESPPSFFPLDPPAESAPANMSIILKPSRYTTEFIELGFLGRGGFGSVYHVRNRLDGAEYAIKKVVLKNEMFRKIQDGGIEAFEKVVKEVNTMAKLEHGNIVRYYGSWIDGLVAEQFVAPVVPIEMDVGAGVLSGAGVFPEALSNEELPHNPGYVDMSDGDIVFQYSDEEGSRVQTLDSTICSKSLSKDVKASNDSDSMGNDNTEDEEGSGDSVELIPRSYPHGIKLATNGPLSPRSPNARSGKAKVIFDLSSSYSSNSESDISGSGLFSAGNGTLIRSKPKHYERGHKRTSSGPVVTLHIQMSLHKLGLTSFLSSPHPSDSAPRHCFCLPSALGLFLGLIDGVAYLHTKGIVHRDLKPGNIFLDALEGKGQCKCLGQNITVVPRIGDFGLVKEIEGAAGANIRGHTNTTVGTEFYRPPPGMAEDDVVGRDLFALGVILVELVYKFGTRMERVKTLSELSRRGELPAGLDKRLAEVVGGCCGLGSHFKNRWDIKRVREAVMHLMVVEVKQ